MTISKDNIRIPVTISKEFKKELEGVAVDQNRSLNNLIVTILKEYLENANAQKK